MNILKHMEAVFVATVALAVTGSYMVDTLPQAHAKPAITVAMNTAAVPVVVVKAKRMSADEKQRAAEVERTDRASRI